MLQAESTSTLQILEVMETLTPNELKVINFPKIVQKNISFERAMDIGETLE
jgi:hypothetical protein